MGLAAFILEQTLKHGRVLTFKAEGEIQIGDKPPSPTMELNLRPAAGGGGQSWAIPPVNMKGDPTSDEDMLGFLRQMAAKLDGQRGG